ncbi:MAG: DUF4399 domain-containing protein [Actinomycetota bacterium]
MAVVLAVAVGSAFALSGCGGDDSAEAAEALRRRAAGEELKVEGVPDDGVLMGNTVELELSGAGVEVVEPDGDTSGRTGHYAVFVDREPVAVGERVPEDDDDVHEVTEDTVQLAGLAAGAHVVKVVIADGRHRRMGPAEAEAEFTVKAPTLQASAADVESSKDPVVVRVEVSGVTLAPPDGSTAATSGHYAVFIDREPTAAGAPVPTERGIVMAATPTVALDDVGGGEHELWVVLVDGAGVPFDPLVADRVTVEVG